MRKLIAPALLAVICIVQAATAQKIDRKALVIRHNVVITKADTLGSLTVGNGKFAFTVDATGLQSFPEYYDKGTPLSTESEWGWYTFPNTEKYQYSETLKEYNFENQPKNGLYAVQMKTGRNQKASDFFRENPHRLQLGNIGFIITKANGSTAQATDLQHIHQMLNLWTGEITSTFTIEGIPVKVITCAHAEQDIIAAKITSPLLQQHRIKVRFRFPYPTNAFADMGTDYTHNTAHQTTMYPSGSNEASFTRKLDDEQYYVSTNWTGKPL